jgi:hypothetical protein
MGDFFFQPLVSMCVVEALEGVDGAGQSGRLGWDRVTRDY